MVSKINNPNTQHETKEKAETLEFQLRQKRDNLTRKLRNIAKGFRDSQLSSQNWMEGIFEAVSNILIHLLNLILGIFGVQLPLIGRPEKSSPALDTECEPCTENLILSKNEQSLDKKSRPMAVKNYLRRTALGLPTSQTVLTNISPGDLALLNSLNGAQRVRLIELPTCEVLDALKLLPNLKLDVASEHTFEPENLNLNPAPRLI